MERSPMPMAWEARQAALPLPANASLFLHKAIVSQAAHVCIRSRVLSTTPMLTAGAHECMEHFLKGTAGRTGRTAAVPI